MSAMGANADPNAPLRRAEVQLEQSGVPFNIIRPNWFMQNFNSYWVHGIVEHGKIFLPVAQAKGSFIDARDIAAVAAALLTRDDMNDRDFDLTGARALDHDEVATILSREAGRRIVFEDIAPEAMLQNLLAAGLPADYAQFMLVILGYFKAGYAQRVTTAVQDITGRMMGLGRGCLSVYTISYATFTWASISLTAILPQSGRDSGVSAAMRCWIAWTPAESKRSG
jgi:uncharacterized protein YbjT (DUF2867 family)